ncbi:Ada metal-binding domain-containing protein [Rhizobium mesoamericanum]|uniref:Ada metal-binding domain-containing protein n=1 Tax=Rhizobium mesoamericanum TaxID=1079800 RepID=UPI0027D8F7EA|nr:Ada metal-binding domain-containing protein [Rhizobium mesoamericanum]
MVLDLPSDALCDTVSAYEGFAWVCVKTTGIFCRWTSPVLKRKRENAAFYESIATCT